MINKMLHWDGLVALSSGDPLMALHSSYAVNNSLQNAITMFPSFECKLLQINKTIAGGERSNGNFILGRVDSTIGMMT